MKLQDHRVHGSKDVGGLKSVIESIDFFKVCGGHKNITIDHECEGRIEKSVPRIAVWHHEACRVMTIGDP